MLGAMIFFAVSGALLVVKPQMLRSAIAPAYLRILGGVLLALGIGLAGIEIFKPRSPDRVAEAKLTVSAARTAIEKADPSDPRSMRTAAEAAQRADVALTRAEALSSDQK